RSKLGFSIRASKWIAYANRQDFGSRPGLPTSKLRQRRLCSEHFGATVFASCRKIRLWKNACPTNVVTNPLLQGLAPL
ncbi:uncharacterized protein ISCGN_005753, partial [Ixodes scapularis]